MNRSSSVSSPTGSLGLLYKDFDTFSQNFSMSSLYLSSDGSWKFGSVDLFDDNVQSNIVKPGCPYPVATLSIVSCIPKLCELKTIPLSYYIADSPSPDSVLELSFSQLNLEF